MSEPNHLKIMLKTFFAESGDSKKESKCRNASNIRSLDIIFNVSYNYRHKLAHTSLESHGFLVIYRLSAVSAGSNMTS